MEEYTVRHRGFRHEEHFNVGRESAFMPIRIERSISETLGKPARVCYLGMEPAKGRCALEECEVCQNFGPERRITERRKKRALLRICERREGFDRRQTSQNRSFPFRLLDKAVLQLRDNRRNLVFLLAVYVLFNVADYALTLRALAVGHTEGNPVMKELLGLGPFGAGGVKVGVSLGVSAAIWALRRNKLVLQVAIAAFLIYSVLMGYHAIGILFYG